MNVGDRVRVERDETLHPSKGTWPRFRGRIGTVVEVNADRNHPHLTEYGVALGKVSARTDGRGAFNWDASLVAWFKAHEIVRVAPLRHGDGHEGITEGEGLYHAVAALARVINLPDRQRALQMAMSRHPANPSAGKPHNCQPSEQRVLQKCGDLTPCLVKSLLEWR
jgi:hypothetical protein